MRLPLYSPERGVRERGPALRLAAYLQYRDPRGLWWPYFETGIGLYDLEDAGSAAGFVAGLGAQRELGSRWASPTT